MVQVPADVTAAHRARWLAELSQALDEAQELLWYLRSADCADAEALDLSARVEATRAEIRSLQLRRPSDMGSDLAPEWTNPLPWERRTDGP